MIAIGNKNPVFLNNKGFSIIEVLVMCSLVGFAVFGLLNASQKAFMSSEFVETHKATGELKNSVSNVLNNHCKENLKPSKLSIANAGLQSITKLESKGRKIVEVGKGFKEGFIQVRDMKITEDKKNFYLYYQYNSPSLGNKQTKGGKKCTNTDLSGCYYLSCKIDYECTGDCKNDSDFTNCKPLDCGVMDKNLSDLICDAGEVLVKFTGVKDDDCVGCPDNHFLVGIKTEGGIKKPQCLQVKKCDTGKVAVGTMTKDGAYIMECMSVVCPTGQHLYLKNNKMECKKVCHGGQKLGADDKCHCPAPMMIDSNGNCV